MTYADRSQVMTGRFKNSPYYLTETLEVYFCTLLKTLRKIKFVMPCHMKRNVTVIIVNRENENKKIQVHKVFFSTDTSMSVREIFFFENITD